MSGAKVILSQFRGGKRDDRIHATGMQDEGYQEEGGDQHTGEEQERRLGTHQQILSVYESTVTGPTTTFAGLLLFFLISKLSRKEVNCRWDMVDFYPHTREAEASRTL